jgi:hypothetical protein
MKPIITKPTNMYLNNGYYNHCGDTFREVIDLWEELELVDVTHSSTTPFCWWGGVGNVLLYDRPNLEWLKGWSDYQVGLFGNPVPPENGSMNMKWIFWGRNPRKLHEFNMEKSYKTYEERKITSIFLGKIENHIQNDFRDCSTWESTIEVFNCNKDYTSGTWKYSHDEYLEMLSNSKYGLCLRGYGPKCNREIELMSMGVVPLITPNVDIGFYNPLIENIHYFKVSNPNDVTQVVKNTSKEHWDVMSKACKKWYLDNCSPQGSFKITNEIVKRYKKPSSICSLCTLNNTNDLKYFLKSTKHFEPNTPIILLCDSGISLMVKDYTNIHCIICLDEFSNKDRKTMEQEGIWNDFMRYKLHCIDEALLKYDDTIYLDIDIVLLQPLPLIDSSKQLGLSPHGIKKENSLKYGYYNAGFIYVNTKEFVKWWDVAIHTSKFYDQGCLEDSINSFTYFEFDLTNNFGWWRLLECEDPNIMSRKFSINTTKKCVTFDNKTLCSIHTHFVDNFPLTIKFNKFINSFLEKCDTFYQNIHNYDTGIIVLVQYYNDTNLDRQQEIDFCFKQNLQNKWVKRVIHFNELHTIIPDWLYNHPKFTSIDHQYRLTFKEALKYANTYLNGEIVCVSNADIFLYYKSKWDELYDFLNQNPSSVAALSRHEYDGFVVSKDPVLSKLHYANAQDSWVFTSPLHNVEDIDFQLGTLGCDNAFANRLVKSGYTPYNFANEYVIVHYDVTRGKNGGNDVSYQHKYNQHTKQTYPEKNGYYLLPEFGSFSDMNSVVQKLNLSKYEQYKFICDMFSYKLKINNEK